MLTERAWQPPVARQRVPKKLPCSSCARRARIIQKRKLPHDSALFTSYTGEVFELSHALKEIIGAIAPSFRAKGYKGSGQNYRCANEKAVSVVNLQKSAGGERFYVNVGVQPLFVPTEAESMPRAKDIKEPECIFRNRVDPLDPNWFGWPYSTDLSAILVQQFERLHASFIIPLMTIPGPITDACVADFPFDSSHPLLGRRHARNFLHFARISLAMGNRETAAQFASAAIDICPPNASSLRYHLEKTLADAKAPQ